MKLARFKFTWKESMTLESCYWSKSLFNFSDNFSSPFQLSNLTKTYKPQRNFQIYTNFIIFHYKTFQFNVLANFTLFPTKLSNYTFTKLIQKFNRNFSVPKFQCSVTHSDFCKLNPAFFRNFNFRGMNWTDFWKIRSYLDEFSRNRSVSHLGILWISFFD